MDVGDRLPGANAGVLDYSYGDYKLLLTATPRRAPGGLVREATRAQRPGELAVATAGLDGLSPDAPAARFDAAARDIVDGLRSPDLVAVSGLGDNSGADDDGTVADDQSVAQLITAISAAGGPAYDWRSVDPRDNADGGRKGSNDRVGFLFRTDRGLAFVDRPSLADPVPDDPPARPDAAVTPVRAVPRGGAAGLTLSPGRIAPGDAAWWRPQAARRGADLAGPPHHRRREPVVPAHGRRPAAVRAPPAAVPAHPVAPGRAGPRGRGLRELRPEGGRAGARDRGGRPRRPRDLRPGPHPRPGRGARRPARRAAPGRPLHGGDRGNAEDLDHILLSPSLRGNRHEFDVVHRSAEFADRAGDRDPTIVRIAVTGR
ncbi:hypothetical protein ACFQY7_52630 [Actinomadura luteofluorescens]|uniref:hypothetical protein n=1 Tax=Actinomadura luteofluorescens TaxID=46163 RepID=UPI00363A7D9F